MYTVILKVFYYFFMFYRLFDLIYNYTDPDNLFLKLAWSYNESDILAGASISKALCVFKIMKDKM